MDEDSLLSIHADRYERLDCIGRGSFGDVFRGWDREAGIEVAIKVIDLEDVEDDIEDIHKEVSVLAQCKSDNITEYYAAVLQPGSTELLIVMELMASSVADLLEEGPLDERSIAFVLREVLKALVYLHSEKRIHRDIKAANVLLSAHGEVKISDFGVSGQLSGTLGYRRRTFVGTPFWMAPEVIQSSDEGYTESADIWSLGIAAIEMAKGKPPHSDLHPMRVLFLIPKEPSPALDGPFSQEFKSFVALCLQKDATKRPSSMALLQHEFLAGPHDSGRLAELVQMHAEKRRAALGPGGRYGETLKAGSIPPKWEFGRKSEEAAAGGTVKGRGTLKSHQINNLTLAEGTWGPSHAKSRLHVASNGGPGGTVRAPPPVLEDRELEMDRRGSSTVVSGSLAAPVTGTVRAAPFTAPLTGLVSAPLKLQNGGSASTSSSDIPLAPVTPSQTYLPPTIAEVTDEVLTSLLQPALASVAAEHGSESAAAAESAVSALAALEGSAPGALRTTLSEVLRLLSSSDLDAGSLSPIKATAEGLFGGAQERAAQAPLNLGPLGAFLLARWRDSVAEDIVRRHQHGGV